MFKFKIIPVILLMPVMLMNIYSQDTVEVKNIDPAKKADIIRLLVAMGNLRVANEVIDYNIKHLKTFLPNLEQSYWDSLLTLIDPNGLLELNAGIYDKYFTHDEIRELIKFYESPAGIKFSENIPLISNEMFEMEDIWNAQISKVLFDKLTQDGHIVRSSPEDQPDDTEQEEE